jgi:hypothetical protein
LLLVAVAAAVVEQLAPTVALVLLLYLLGVEALQDLQLLHIHMLQVTQL